MPAEPEVCRDPQFWISIASDPAVAPTLLGYGPEAVAEFVASDRVIPVAFEHGGFLLAKMDGFGRALELHTLVRPEGWGRPVVRAAIATLRGLPGWDLIMTFEAEDNKRSRPWRGLGFVPAGSMTASLLGPMRTWVLTRSAWESSPYMKG